MTGARRGERSPVLESKLQAPRMPATTTTRTQLLHDMAVAEEAGQTTTVVTAPAGAGKTVLLSQRYEDLRSAGALAAWLSLDDGDDDPSRFWSGVLAACAHALRARDGLVPAELEALSPPAGRVSAGFLAAWHDAIEPLEQMLWLIIDDVHELTEHTVLDGLARMLRTAPPWLRLLLSSRHDMPLPVPRMLVAGTASEIRSADLAFTMEEARELLSGYGVGLTDRDLSLLLARTEGWAAGLKLAALSLSQQEDVSSFVAAFAGDDRPVADYLVHEVLSRQAVDVRAFLLSTAIPAQMTADLADELTGRVDSGLVLEQLVHHNVFTYRQDSSPRTYRYHPLLRSYLLAELSNNDAPAVRRLHARAADWFAAHGAPAQALNHSVAARDWIRVADLLDQYGLQLMLSGDTAALKRALAAAPAEVLADPRVCLVAALVALQDGDSAVAERHLDQVGRDPARHADSRLRLLHATSLLHEARLRGERSQQLQARVEQTRWHVVDDPDLQLVAAANRGAMLITLGDFAGADATLTAALRLARSQQRDWLALECLSQLALTAAALGDAHGMVTRARQAIDFAAARGWARSSPMVRSYLIAAWGAWHMMDVADAERLVSLAAGIDSDVEPHIELSVRILHSYTRFARAGDRNALVHELSAAWVNTVHELISPRAVSHYGVTDLRTALSTGDKGWADEAIARTRRLLDDTGDVAVMNSMVSGFRGRNAAARKELATVLTGERTCHAVTTQIVAWLLEAQLADANDEPPGAHDAVVRALELAGPLRLIRDIATAPERVQRLLIRGRGAVRHPRDVRG